jgi:hypothetical protein
MPVRLIAEFAGLIAMVQGPNGVDAVAVNGTFDRGWVKTVGVHTTRLAIDASAVCLEDAQGDLPQGCKADSTPPQLFVLGPDGKRLAVWTINDRKVEFVATDGFVERDLDLWDNEQDFDDEQPGTGLTRWTEGAWKDVAWIASLTKASDGLTVDPQYLYLPVDPKKSPTQALVRLERGTLRARRPSEKKMRGDKFAFKQGNYLPSHTRAVSDRVTVETVALGQVSLKLVRYIVGSDPWVIHLRSQGRKKIRLAFGNLPEEYHAPDSVAIEHFRAFYNLLTEKACQIRIPTRTGHKKHGKHAYIYAHKAAASSSDCPPAFAQRGH